MEKIISVDWGTTNFRLRLVDTGNTDVIGELSTGDGIASVYNLWRASGDDRQSFYLSILSNGLEQLAGKCGQDLDGLPVLISGMASSTLGIVELPYARLPFAADGGSIASLKLVAPGFNHEAWLISGVRSENDVMRGEETQWIGLMQDDRFTGDDGFVFIFPGTHSKHVFVKQRQLTDFKTYMTGEFFNILSTYSVLKNSVKVELSLQSSPDEDAFIQGVHAATKLNLLHESFMVRTNDVFNRLTHEQNASYLSGLLIGTEVLQLGRYKIVLTAGTSLSQLYSMALEHVMRHDTDQRSQIILCPPAVHDKSVVNGQLTIFKKILQTR